MGKTASSFFSGLLIGVLLAVAGFALLVRTNNRSGSTGRFVTVLKLGHGLDQNHPVHAAMLFMAERLQEKSSGTVTLQIFPNSQLGSETEMIEQVQRGALAMTKTSTAPMEGFVPEMAVFGVPYVFRDDDHFWDVALGPIGQRLLVSGSEIGLRGICYYDAGARSFYTVDRAVMTPADLGGLKIRVQKSRTAMDMVTSLGGSPTPIPWGELYTALQQSLVDGAENNPPSFYSNRHFEVCKHLSLDEHARVPDILLFSEKNWATLPENARRWIQESADESVVFQRKLWKEKSDEALQAVQKEGVTIHRPDKTEFVKSVANMRKALEGTPVGELLNEIDKR